MHKPDNDKGRFSGSRPLRYFALLLIVTLTLVAGFKFLEARSAIDGAYHLPSEIDEKHVPYHLWNASSKELAVTHETWEGAYDHHLINRPLLYYKADDGDFVVSRDNAGQIVAITMYKADRVSIHARWIRCTVPDSDEDKLYYLTNGLWPAEELSH